MNNLLLEALLVLVGLVFTIIFFRYLFFGSNFTRAVFTASDDSTFNSQEACDAYESLLKRISFLYEDESSTKNRSKKEISGMKPSFIKLLKEGGFKDLKTLVKYKDDLKKLVDLFELEEETD